MRLHNKIVVTALVIISAFTLTACFEPAPEKQAKKVLSEKTEGTDETPAETGYEYAEKTGIEDEKIEEAIAKAGEVIEIESIDSYLNEAPTNREVNTIDLRVANVTAKDGKKYTVCFDGIRGTLFGVIDEDGNNLIDNSEVSEDFADVVLGDTYVEPEN